jgi:hypothetical protein
VNDGVANSEDRLRLCYPGTVRAQVNRSILDKAFICVELVDADGPFKVLLQSTRA